MKPIKILHYLCELFNSRNYQFLTDQEFNSGVIPDRYLKNEQAMLIIKDVISDMAYEVEQSEAGRRGTVLVDNPNKGQGMFQAINTSTKSTFPPFMREAGFRDKKSFLRAVKQGKGKAWNRIALRAIIRLERGTDPRNVHNQDGPDTEFMDLVLNPIPF